MSECHDDTETIRALLKTNMENIVYLRDRLDKIEVVVGSLTALATHMDYLRNAVVELTTEMKEMQRLRTKAQASWHNVTLLASSIVGLAGLVVMFLQVWDRIK